MANFLKNEVHKSYWTSVSLYIMKIKLFETAIF